MSGQLDSQVAETASHLPSGNILPGSCLPEVKVTSLSNLQLTVVIQLSPAQEDGSNMLMYQKFYVTRSFFFFFSSCIYKQTSTHREQTHTESLDLIGEFIILLYTV